MDTTTFLIPPANTIAFHLGEPSAVIANLGENLRQSIANFPNVEDFRDAHIIRVENSIGGRHDQNCYGVTIAMGILRKNPKAKVVLYGVLPVVLIRTKAPEIDLVLQYENVRWIEMPFNTGEFAKIFQEGKTATLPGAYTITQEIKKYLSGIFHDIKYVKNWDTNPAAEDYSKFQKCMDKVKEYFPSFKDATDESIINFLKTVSESREEIMKDQRITGVYCDVEGTLLVNDKINERVFALLQQYSAEGKLVTIWTDGNIAEIEPKLRALRITYPVKSKFDHSGAIAEIVIDDQDEFTFTAITKITATKFICASQLN